MFAEAVHPTMLKAAVQAKAEGICYPILLGNDEVITKLAASLDLSLDGIEIVNLRHPNEQERRERYARILTEKRQREGYTFQEAKYKHFGTMHIINSPKGTYYIADTMVNENPSEEALLDISKLVATAVRFFNEKPVIALVSHSNFGSSTSAGALKVKNTVAKMQELYPDLPIDGEMLLSFALDNELRDQEYPFTKLKDKKVNTLVFPNLTSARSSYKMLQMLGSDAEIIGPIQMGLNKPIHFIDFGASVRDVVNIVAVATIDAYVDKIKNKLSALGK